MEVRSLFREIATILSNKIREIWVNAFKTDDWCSGYHVCFTMRRNMLHIAAGRKFDPCIVHSHSGFVF